MLEPGHAFVPGHHITAIAEHLEACSRGDIRDLIINVPPGHMKSLTVGSFWPAWEWINHPEKRFLSASHNVQLAIRDARKMRTLIRSPWFQKHWGERFSISPDQDQKQRFENTKGGYRLCVSTTTGTGEGGNHLCVDDPHNAQTIMSDVERNAVLTWWKETGSQRQRPPGSGARVIIMQRLHTDDLAGYLLKEGGWVHLMLPAEFEPERACETVPLPSTHGEPWRDWRTDEDELLWPEMFDAAKVARAKRELGSSFAVAGQLQQRPAPRGGGIIKADWWQLWKHDEYPRFDLLVASVDTAYEEKESSAFSACTVWGTFTDDHGNTRIMLVWAWEERLEFNGLIDKLALTAKRFAIERMLIEAKASGKSVIQELRRRRIGPKGMSVIAIEPMGDKVARLHAAAGVFESGYVFAPDKKWASMVIDRTSGFPAVTYKDLVDTVSQGINWLRRIGLDLYPEDRIDETFVPSGAGQPASLY